MPNPADAPVASADNPTDDWTSLLSVATLEDVADRKKRAKVDVPDAVLNLVKRAREGKQRITLPYDAAKFAELSDVFYSAGDLLEPKASVQVTRVDAKGKPVKDDTATAMRIFVGDRRGQKGGKKSAEHEPQKDDAEKADV